jgi:hypothetical protein
MTAEGVRSRWHKSNSAKAQIAKIRLMHSAKGFRIFPFCSTSDYASVVACETAHFKQVSPEDCSGGGAICSNLLILPEVFQVHLKRVRSNWIWRIAAEILARKKST